MQNITLKNATRKFSRSLLYTALGLSLSGAALAGNVGGRISGIVVGPDNNSTANAFVQPQDPALAGNGRDQTLQFGDVLTGSRRHDVILGGLGVDVLSGRGGNDVILGGTEHFNPQNRDRAFGDRGRDVFVWAPGDGSDFFDGGQGEDAVVFGLVGEIEDHQLVFRVSNDQQAGNVALDPFTNLPVVDVTNSPGFCRVIDESTSPEARDALDELGLDHLVQFVIRGIADAFERGEQTVDNGLRVTLHLKDVEVLVCADRFGGAIEVLDLTQSPAQPMTWEEVHELHPQLLKRLANIVR